MVTMAELQNTALQSIYYIFKGRAFLWIIWNCVTASPHYSHLMVDQKNEEVRMSLPDISRVTLNSQPPSLFHLS